MQAISWSYLGNPFDSMTKRSHKRMFLLATDHFDKLKAAAASNPEIQRLYDFGIPYYEAFRKEYLSGSRDADAYRKYTQHVEDLMIELMSLIRRWDSFITFNFDVGTPEYEELMPNGRAPFQGGAYEERIKALENLSQKLSTYPTLAPIQPEVEEFSKKLLTARSEQQAMEHTDQKNVGELEEKRFALAQALRGIMGGLALTFFDRLWEVETFYELKYLRVRSSSGEGDPGEVRDSETLEIAAESKATILTDRLKAGDNVRVTNTGGQAIQAYFITTEEKAIEAITIEGGQSGTLTASANDVALQLENTGSRAVEVVVELL